jgi:hypothetical protein
VLSRTTETGANFARVMVDQKWTQVIPLQEWSDFSAKFVAEGHVIFVHQY